MAPDPGAELKQTLLEIQAGVRRSDAFHRLSNRTGVEDLRTLSAMIIQTEMFGTSVSRALRVHSEGMRTKRMQRAEEKAAIGLGQDDRAAHHLHPSVADGGGDRTGGRHDHQAAWAAGNDRRPGDRSSSSASARAPARLPAAPAASPRPELRRHLARCNLARDLVGRGDWGRAFAMLDELHRERPDDAEILTLRGIVYRERGLFSDAEADLLAAVKARPESAEAHAALGILYDVQLRNEAEAQHREAVRLAPANPAYLNNLGFSLYLRHRFREAIAEYDQGGAAGAAVAPGPHQHRASRAPRWATCAARRANFRWGAANPRRRTTWASPTSGAVT